jgi:hypothetical protein
MFIEDYTKIATSNANQRFSKILYYSNSNIYGPKYTMAVVGKTWT